MIESFEGFMRRLDWKNIDSPVLVAGPYRLDRAKPHLRESFQDQSKIGTADHKKTFFRAKYGQDAEAAKSVVEATFDDIYLTRVRLMLHTLDAQGIERPILVAPSREGGRNALACAAAEYLGGRLGLEVDTNITQLESPSRKAMYKLDKLFNFPAFSGSVVPDRHYVPVDDMLGTGGTIAELRSYIMNNGGKYAFSCCMASSSGQDHLLNNTPKQVSDIVEALGQNVTEWFQATAQIRLSALTRVESYLLAGGTAKAKLSESMERAA